VWLLQPGSVTHPEEWRYLATRLQFTEVGRKINVFGVFWAQATRFIKLFSPVRLHKGVMGMTCREAVSFLKSISIF
jgi:hypothetical protein